MSLTRAQELFADRKFGLFIHWGLYSILGRGEWVLFNEKLPAEQYEALRHQFTGEKFDSDAIADLAATAGMKYVVLTAKHHDGFCLYDSALTDYTSVRSAAGRDFIGELAEACRSRDLGFHPYYSLWDWRHPDFVPDDPDRWQGYLDYYQGQVRELCTNYGPLSGMWFDPGGGQGPDYDFKRTADIVHELQPDAAVMSWDYWIGEHTFKRLTRLDDHGHHMLRGDVAQSLESVLFEACETINDSWGYNATDKNYKSVGTLLGLLVDVVGRGGNLLLNIGPYADGSVDTESVARLREIGRWLKDNGDALYGTRAQLHPRINGEGYTITRENHAYFLLRNLAPLLDRLSETSDPLETLEGVAEVRFNGVRSQVESVHAKGKPTSLDFSQDGTKLAVSVPRKALRWRHFVLDVETRGKAEVDLDIRPEPDGSLVCNAEVAAIFTSSPGEPGYYADRDRIGNWNHADAKLVWLARIEREGDYRVTLDYSCDKTAAGSPYEIRIGDSLICQTTTATDSWTDFALADVGTVHLPTGNVQVEIKALKLLTYAFVDLRSIRLTPCE